MRYHGRLDRAAKRLVDVVGATAGLVVLSPLIAWISLAVLIVDGRPILFRHVRPGYRERTFTMFKFRTMRAPHRDEVWYRTDEQRMTGLGRFLRSASLDELPELWNVLRGEMSLVGPRPLLVEYLDRYRPEERRRHDVRPGITGWAAVNGRHTKTFSERVKMDLWYVDHWSIALDVRIIAMTVWQVLHHTDVTASQDPALGFPLPDVPDSRTTADGPARGEEPE
ncbi:MAG: sugar transferase [Candidatus Limnocylindrales bacterium]